VNDTNLDTGFFLALRYKTPVIPLETAVSDFLPHLSHDVARRRASTQSLPFPTFRADASQKSDYYVNIADIASWLEQNRAEAAAQWAKVNH
jgi:hypothetical protein